MATTWTVYEAAAHISRVLGSPQHDNQEFLWQWRCDRTTLMARMPIAADPPVLFVECRDPSGRMPARCPLRFIRIPDRQWAEFAADMLARVSGGEVRDPASSSAELI